MGHFFKCLVSRQNAERVNAGFFINVFFHFTHRMLAAYVLKNRHVSKVRLRILYIALVPGIIHFQYPLPKGMEKMIHDHHEINKSSVPFFVFLQDKTF